MQVGEVQPHEATAVAGAGADELVLQVGIVSPDEDAPAAGAGADELNLYVEVDKPAACSMLVYAAADGLDEAAAACSTGSLHTRHCPRLEIG